MRGDQNVKVYHFIFFLLGNKKRKAENVPKITKRWHGWGPLQPKQHAENATRVMDIIKHRDPQQTKCPWK